YGVANLYFSGLGRPLLVHLSAPRIWGIGGAFLTICLGLVAAYLSVATVVLAAVLFGGAWALMHTSLQAWATQVIPQARGLVVAFFAGSLFSGSSAGSALAGTLAEAGRWTLIFCSAASVAFGLTATAVVALSRYQSLPR